VGFITFSVKTRQLLQFFSVGIFLRTEL